MKQLKKYLALLLAVAMIAAGGVVALADNGDESGGGTPGQTDQNNGDDDDKDDGGDGGGGDSEDNKPGTTPTGPVITGDPFHESHESAAKAVTESNRAQQETAIAAIEAISAGESAGNAVKVQEVATAAGNTVQAVSAKLYGAGASLSLKSMAAVADASVSLNVSLDNGAAEILIPAGFTMPSTPGVVGFSIGYQQDPLYANLMTRQVKGDNAKTEVCKLGGGTLPTTATVSVKTKLTGPVNIYYWNEDTRKATLLATATAENGKVSFATQQMGNMIITTGTV